MRLTLGELSLQQTRYITHCPDFLEFFWCDSFPGELCHLHYKIDRINTVDSKLVVKMRFGFYHCWIDIEPFDEKLLNLLFQFLLRHLGGCFVE